ncbi:MAG: hypothetical protein ABL962_13720 [Fimbriimonadaceae bacterium]
MRRLCLVAFFLLLTEGALAAPCDDLKQQAAALAKQCVQSGSSFSTCQKGKSLAEKWRAECSNAARAPHPSADELKANLKRRLEAAIEKAFDSEIAKQSAALLTALLKAKPNPTAIADAAADLSANAIAEAQEDDQKDYRDFLRRLREAAERNIQSAIKAMDSSVQVLKNVPRNLNRIGRELREELDKKTGEIVRNIKEIGISNTDD